MNPLVEFRALNDKIEDLEKELEKRDRLLDEAEYYLRNSNPHSHIEFKVKINWLKQYEEMRLR